MPINKRHHVRGFKPHHCSTFNKAPCNFNTAYGFSLTETLITVLMIALSSLFTVPKLQRQIEWQTQRHNTLHAVKTARAFATQVNQAVILCHLDDQGQCTGFSSPLTTFADANNNKRFDTGETLLATAANIVPLTHWRKDRNLIRFRKDGTLWGYFGSLNMCHHSGLGQKLVLSPTGRIKPEPLVNDQCIPTQ